MHEHDQELIMALAEGSIGPEAADRVASEIAACPECSRDLELQRIAIDALNDAPAVYLTATESARLHDRLRSELGTAPATPARARASVAWGRWAGFALGTAAVLLAAFLVLPAVLGGGSDDAADMVAFEQSSADMGDGATSRTETTAAASPTAEAPQMAVDEVGGAEMATTTAAAAETTAAPETTVAAESEEPADDAYAFEYIVEGSLSEQLRSEIVADVTADPAYFSAGDETAKSLNPEWAACLETTAVLAAGPDGASAQLVGQLMTDAGRELLLVAFITPDPSSTTLATVAIPDCAVVETLP